MEREIIARVYLPWSGTPLTPSELVIKFAEVGGVASEDEMVSDRLSGHLCSCEHGGEFELFPLDHPGVVEGGKRYMKCRKCGEVSHL